ncbi:uncharacterized protein LOC144445048 [Glandiceps talaboti]
MGEIELRPSEIRFLHNSIANHFRNGTDILVTFEDLLYQNITPDDIPIIRVFRRNRKWYIYQGHRRLYIYKRLQKQCVINAVTVKEVKGRKIDWDKVRRKDTSENDGKSVTIRGDDKFHGRLGQIVQNWINTNSDSDECSSDSDRDYEYDTESEYEYESGSDSDVDDLVDRFGNWRW